MINRARIRALRDWLNAEPERFNMSDFLTRSIGWDGVCRTTMCLAGEVVVAHKLQRTAVTDFPDAKINAAANNIGAYHDLAVELLELPAFPGRSCPLFFDYLWPDWYASQYCVAQEIGDRAGMAAAAAELLTDILDGTVEIDLRGDIHAQWWLNLKYHALITI